MIKNVISSIVIAVAFAISAQAGTPDKTISQPATTVDYGTGPYVAVQGGFNAAQDTFEWGSGNPYNKLGTVATQSAIGGFGGLKAGYVFGHGLVRPTVEFDGFYNGFSQNTETLYTHRVGKFDVNTGVYMSNALLRFNLGAFQPYAGAGIGVYSGESDVTYTDGYHFTSGESTSWAWQIIVGADYFLTPTISVFAEYKFLNFMDAETSNFPSTNDRLGQQLAGGGVRFYF